MGKKVLGVTINVNKTNGHFASSNEMFGTLISGIGLTGNQVLTIQQQMLLDNRISFPINNSEGSREI